ncbi:hypothetical protein HED49_01065 [Ochrobactrum daejeonense]|nr:hypothetical protein [Brucella daejeonensis]
MTAKNPSPSLYNEDLAPAEERKWGAFSIFNVWTSDVHSLWGYYLAASLFLLCGSFLNFIIAIGIGSLVIFFLMSLVGNAGVRTGVPSRCWRARPSVRSAPIFPHLFAALSPVSGTARKPPLLPGPS